MEVLVYFRRISKNISPLMAVRPLNQVFYTHCTRCNVHRNHKCGFFCFHPSLGCLYPRLLLSTIVKYYLQLGEFCLLPEIWGSLTLKILPSAGIFKQSMGAKKRVGIGLSYRPARLHSLAKLVPWNRFLGSLKV